jgi:hypothetical protein
MVLSGQPGLTDTYRETADRIIEAAMADTEGFEKLTHLTTHIGHRLSGSSSLERAIEWAYEEMREQRLDNVRKLPVRVPHWVRGRESARVLSPVEKPLAILGLGGSVATSGGPLVAPVVAVRSFEELAALGRDGVQGKIVLYAVPLAGLWRDGSISSEWRVARVGPGRGRGARAIGDGPEPVHASHRIAAI